VITTAIMRTEGIKLRKLQKRDFVKYFFPILIILMNSWKRKYPLKIKRIIESPKKPCSSYGLNC
jgi:hypothetical protein